MRSAFDEEADAVRFGLANIRGDAYFSPSNKPPSPQSPCGVCALGNVAVKVLIELAAFCHMILELVAVRGHMFGGERSHIVMMEPQFDS